MNNLRKFWRTIIIAAVMADSCVEESKVKNVVHEITFLGDDEVSLPYLYANDETLFLSWVKMIDDSIAQLNYSYLIDENWENPKEIIRGGNWFVNWADFPSITEHNGTLLTHFLQKSSGGKFAYDVKLNVLPEDASQWKTDLELHTDGTKTEHGFVAAVPYQENSFFVAWLDGRDMEANHDHNHGAGHNDAMGIRAATVSMDGTVSNEVLLDGMTCSCCQTTAAITANGPVVLYRDRTADDIRDIAITRQVNGQWTTPIPIHDDGWMIAGCPVNGPKADAIGNDLVVAWFTGVNGKPMVQVIFSDDGGTHFGSPLVISDAGAVGRVDVLLLDGETALVSWMETGESETYLRAMKVSAHGQQGDPITISRLDGARSSGFPQMERLGDRVYFAWTAIETEIPRIKIAYISVADF